MKRILMVLGSVVISSVTFGNCNKFVNKNQGNPKMMNVDFYGKACAPPGPFLSVVTKIHNRNRFAVSITADEDVFFTNGTKETFHGDFVLKPGETRNEGCLADTTGLTHCFVEEKYKGLRISHWRIYNKKILKAGNAPTDQPATSQSYGTTATPSTAVNTPRPMVHSDEQFKTRNHCIYECDTQEKESSSRNRCEHHCYEAFDASPLSPAP